MVDVILPEYPLRRNIWVSQGDVFRQEYVWKEDGAVKWDVAPIEATAKFQVRQTLEIEAPALISITEEADEAGQVMFFNDGIVSIHLTPAGTNFVTTMQYAHYGLVVTLPEDEEFRLAQGRYWFNRAAVY